MTKFIGLLMGVAFALNSYATQVETQTINDVAAKVREMGKKYSKEQVIVVFDMDNTLLAMNQDLGSDQWFSWQSKLPKSDGNRVGKNFSALLNVQGILFSMGQMHTVEKHTATVVRGLQKEGYRTLVLTSRGPEFRSASMKEFKRNDFNFSANAIGPVGGFASKYKPYDGINHGFTKMEQKLFSVKKQRKVSYQDGIYMTAGQHKGAMLRAILKKTSTSVKAVVFMDDHKKHTDRVEAAFKDSGIETWSYRYGKEDLNVKRFVDGKKTSAILGWKKLNTAMKTALSFQQ
ncbi:MAG: DUF2608 domain-containing protein [Bacteriovoracaceae bacterium]|nr:DUF2608 domain-containing protein [Bacteriovoracaceae bacterium]